MQIDKVKQLKRILLAAEQLITTMDEETYDVVVSHEVRVFPIDERLNKIISGELK